MTAMLLRCGKIGVISMESRSLEPERDGHSGLGLLAFALEKEPISGDDAILEASDVNSALDVNFVLVGMEDGQVFSDLLNYLIAK
jgi:hypothetical protein